MPPAGPLEYAPPSQEDRGRGAFDPYVSPPVRLAAAWSWRGLVILAGIGVLFWLLAKVTIVLLPALIALLIVALLSPLNSLLVRLGWPKGLAAATVFIGFIVVVVGLIVLVGQQIISGFSELWSQVVAGFRSISDWLASNPYGLDSQQISKTIDDAVNQAVDYVQTHSSDLVGGAAGAVSSFGTFLTGLLLCLFTAFFFLLDGRNIFSWSLRLLPVPARARTEGALLRGWQTLVQYVRVQVIVAAVDAVGIGIGAFFLQIPLVIPLTIAVFLGSFVPIVGAVLTGIIAVLVALVSQGPISALIMLGVVLLVQQVESNVLQPFIMGKAVSIHPLAVVLSVAAASFLFGIPGALFAVPLIAMLNTICRYLAGEDLFAPDGEAKTDGSGKGESPVLERRADESPVSPSLDEEVEEGAYSSRSAAEAGSSSRGSSARSGAGGSASEESRSAHSKRDGSGGDYRL